MRSSKVLILSVGIACWLSAVAPSNADLAATPDTPAAEGRVGVAVAAQEENPAQRWSELMQIAWHEEATGRHRASLSHATQALEIASAMGDSFRIGRSLCWLGWSATSLGLYPLALEFYAEAIEHGSDGSRIVHVPVWGLATQETGALYAKMGELEKGQKLIETTTDFATRHGIDVGVSEGGAHLAAIALERGDLSEAEDWAEKAVAASLRCNCSPTNTHRAQLVAARVTLLRAETNPKLRGDAAEAIEALIRSAEKSGDRRYGAEAKLLLSHTVDPENVERRVALVSEAANLLHAIESESRGSADAQLGAVLLDDQQHVLATAYLKSGLAINEAMLRKLDSAYALVDLAEIDAQRSDASASLEKRMRAADQARESGAWILAADAEEQLALDLRELGFDALSRQWGERAIFSLDHLLFGVGNDVDRARALQLRRLRLTEHQLEIDLELLPGTPPTGAAPR